MSFIQKYFPTFQKVSKKDVVTFTRELSILHKAGLSLVRSLVSLQEQMPECKFKNVLGELVEGIERGDTFSESLQQFPKIFPKLYVNMIRSGEMGGELDQVLKRLATLLEKEERLKKKIKAALIYPAFVLVVAVGILGLLMVIVVPTFSKIFEDLGGELPGPTQLLINMSTFFSSFWYLMLLGAFLLFQLFRLALRNDKTKLYIDKFALVVPIFGKLIRNVSVASFSRTLGTLLNSGVSIIQALQIVRETQTNLVFANIVPDLIMHIKEGENLSVLIQQSNIFPHLMVKMVSVGEETGELSDMLVEVADNYEEEVDILVGSLASLLEPLLIVVMGFIVGFIVIAMFLPLFNMTKLI